MQTLFHSVHGSISLHSIMFMKIVLKLVEIIRHLHKTILKEDFIISNRGVLFTVRIFWYFSLIYDIVEAYSGIKDNDKTDKK